jgi:RNA polymerase sigma-70 factor (ECF subfamily)
MVASREAMANELGAEPTALCKAGQLAYARPMGHTAKDSALMLRYQDGDTSAFETLYRRHNDALYRYLMRHCRHPATAEDIFQDVWGKIIKARATYRPTAKFTTFMYRVAHNCFIDHIRRNKRHSNNTELDPELYADTSETPETATERSLAKERLAIALNDLPDEQKDAYLLHEEAGLSIDQIASVTGSNRETAKSRLRYAVNKLRAAIEEPQ